MWLSLISPVLGLATSVVPELVTAWFKSRQDDRDKAQQLQLEQLQLERDRAGLQARADEAHAQLQIEQVRAETSLQIEEARGQWSAFLQAQRNAGQASGVKWVDATNALVRPVLTYATLLLLAWVNVAWYALRVPPHPELWNDTLWNLIGWVWGFWFGHRGFHHAKAAR